MPSLRDEMLTITNHTGHPSLTLRAGFVDVSQARSDWAPDPAHPLGYVEPADDRVIEYDEDVLAALDQEGDFCMRQPDA